MDPEGERQISAYVKEEFGHEFVFLTDYASSIRPFYHMRHADDPALTKSYDLIFNGVEISTGAQREHRVEVLEAQAREKGLEPEELDFYLDFFRYGVPPHGGFGMGLARVLMLMLHLPNLRETTYLFRGPTACCRSRRSPAKGLHSPPATRMWPRNRRPIVAAGLIEPPGEHVIGDARIERARRMVVRDREGTAAPQQHRLEDVGRLDARLVDSAVAHDDQLDGTGCAVGDHHDEPFGVAMHQLGGDDLGDRGGIDEPRPGGRAARATPDLDDGDQAPGRRRSDAGKRLQAREIHRRQARETSGSSQNRPGEGEHAAPGLPGTEDQGEHFVVGERPDADATHPLPRSVVRRHVGQRIGQLVGRRIGQRVGFVGHAHTLRRAPSRTGSRRRSVDSHGLWKWV